MTMNIYRINFFNCEEKKKPFSDKDFLLLLHGSVLYNILNNYISYCLKSEV